MRKFKINYLKCLCLLLFALLGFYVLVFAIPKSKNLHIYNQKQVETKVYTIWHVETFESGSKKSVQYLKNIASNFENSHKGILFAVNEIKPDELSVRLEHNKPDIISFGFGVGQEILPHLIELDVSHKIRDEVIASAKFSNKIMCVPYYLSGYSSFTHGGEITETICGENSYVSPTKFYNNITRSFKSQYEAYSHFVNNKKSCLIGTSKDLFRVSKLNDIGRLNTLITPLEVKTDLIQYCGVLKSDKITIEFIKELINDKNQLKLVDLGLFSVCHNKIYSQGIYNDMENAILNSQIANVFDE